jgi:hypothetical protein
MPKESISIHTAGGAETAGEAEIVRYSTSSRIIQATLWAIGGLLGGTACIIIPVVHLFTTWGLPLLGILMAVRTMRREIVIHEPTGTCPHCKEKIELAGGAANDPEWQVCPHCKTAIQVRPQAAISPAR